MFTKSLAFGKSKLAPYKVYVFIPPITHTSGDKGILEQTNATVFVLAL